jgi:hypothetical protein
VDAKWVARALADLDSLWDSMTSENRGRLVAGLIERVVVDDRRGEVEIVMADDSGVAT